MAAAEGVLGVVEVEEEEEDVASLYALASAFTTEFRLSVEVMPPLEATAAIPLAIPAK
jgi:hypothetical protein